MRPLLEMYVDGELDATAGLELERHLEDCDECAQARGQLLALRQALRAEAPRFPAPARLRDNLQSSLRRSARPRFVMPPWVWPAVTAASLLPFTERSTTYAPPEDTFVDRIDDKTRKLYRVSHDRN